MNDRTRPSTVKYDYTPDGWATSQGGSKNPNALVAVVADRHVYPAFSYTIRTYNVSFVRNGVDGGGTLYTQRNVPYGSMPTYSGPTPTTTQGTAEEGYGFLEWTPKIVPVDGVNLTYTAKFDSPYDWVTLNKTVTDLVDAVERGGYKLNYSKGNTIPITIGTRDDLQVSIVGIDNFEDKYGNKIPLTLLITKVYTYNYNGRGQASYPDQFGLNTVFEGLPEAIKKNVPVMKQEVRQGGSQGTDTYETYYNRVVAPTNTEMLQMIKQQTDRAIDRTIYVNDAAYRGAQLAGSFTKQNFGSIRYGWVLVPTGVITENTPYNDYRYGFIYAFNLAPYEQVKTLYDVTWEDVFASIDASTYATDFAIGDIIPLNLYGTDVGAEITGFDENNGHITFVTYRSIPGQVSGRTGVEKKTNLEAYVNSHLPRAFSSDSAMEESFQRRYNTSRR